jgi:stage III sporulation protein AB
VKRGVTVAFKIAGSIIILTATGFLGYYLSADCKKRPVQLRELQSMLAMLENQICFLSDVLAEAFERVCRSTKSEVGVFFSTAAEKLKTSAGITAFEAWEQAVRDNIGKTALNGDDGEILISFGKMLGNSDTEGQIRNIRLAVSQLKLQEQAAEEKREKHEGMFRSLGILFGLALVIILI